MNLLGLDPLSLTPFSPFLHTFHSQSSGTLHTSKPSKPCTITPLPYHHHNQPIIISALSASPTSSPPFLHSCNSDVGRLRRRNSNNPLLQELEALTQSLYQSHTTRCIASVALPRSAASPIPIDDSASARQNSSEEKTQQRHRSRRMSLSPWRSRPKLDDTEHLTDLKPTRKLEAATLEKKGIWNWKPIRAISHIRGNTPHPVPSLLHGLGKGNHHHLKFKPRPFLIYVVAVGAEEINFGKILDLSLLVQESMEKNLEEGHEL